MLSAAVGSFRLVSRRLFAQPHRLELAAQRFYGDDRRQQPFDPSMFGASRAGSLSDVPEDAEPGDVLLEQLSSELNGEDQDASDDDDFDDNKVDDDDDDDDDDDNDDDEDSKEAIRRRAKEAHERATSGRPFIYGEDLPNAQYFELSGDENELSQFDDRVAVQTPAANETDGHAWATMFLSHASHIDAFTFVSDRLASPHFVHPMQLLACLLRLLGADDEPNFHQQENFPTLARLLERLLDYDVLPSLPDDGVKQVFFAVHDFYAAQSAQRQKHLLANQVFSTFYSLAAAHALQKLHHEHLLSVRFQMSYGGDNPEPAVRAQLPDAIARRVELLRAAVLPRVTNTQELVDATRVDRTFARLLRYGNGGDPLPSDDEEPFDLDRYSDGEDAKMDAWAQDSDDDDDAEDQLSFQKRAWGIMREAERTRQADVKRLIESSDDDRHDDEVLDAGRAIDDESESKTAAFEEIIGEDKDQLDSVELQRLRGQLDATAIEMPSAQESFFIVEEYLHEVESRQRHTDQPRSKYVRGSSFPERGVPSHELEALESELPVFDYANDDADLHHDLEQSLELTVDTINRAVDWHKNHKHAEFNELLTALGQAAPHVPVAPVTTVAAAQSEPAPLNNDPFATLLDSVSSVANRSQPRK